MLNIEHITPPDEMPLCPICDHPVFTYEPMVAVESGGVAAAAHESCMLDAKEEVCDE